MELNTRYTVTTPAGEISDRGITLLLQHLNAQRLQLGDWKALNADKGWVLLPPLPDDWAWVWVVARGDYAGTMPKRISKYFYKTHGLKSPESFLQEIGNIARRHSTALVTYTFEFVNRFNWRPGEFGDGGSCYFGGRGAALEMLEENGGMAMCFFDETGRSLARAWLVPAEGVHIVFNGYGFAGTPTLTIARVLALHLSASYKKIHLENAGSASGALWINNAVGYAVGPESVIDGIDDYDFEWTELYRDYCAECGTGLDEDNSYYGPDDQSYCEECYYRLFDSCSICGETYYRENVTVVGHDYVCDYCLERRYSLCDGCGEYFPNDEVHYDEEREASYCEACSKQDD
jgi:hypothetical protein